MFARTVNLLDIIIQTFRPAVKRRVGRWRFDHDFAKANDEIQWGAQLMADRQRKAVARVFGFFGVCPSDDQHIVEPL